MTELAEALAEHDDKRTVRFLSSRNQAADPGSARLLCARRERPRRRAAKKGDELTSPHIGTQAQGSALYPLKRVL
jgi:hypothetical protein